MPELLVIAGDYRQYQEWRRLSGKTEKEAPYIGDAWQLAGYPPDLRVIAVGTPWKNAAFDEARARRLI